MLTWPLADRQAAARRVIRGKEAAAEAATEQFLLAHPDWLVIVTVRLFKTTLHIQ